MISIFKVFNPLNVLWLAILMFILRIGYIAHVPDKLEFTFVEPFARLLVPVSYEYAFSPTANIFWAGVLVLAQALLLNYLVNHFNLLGRPTFLPSLMYVTLTALFAPFMVLSAPLICNFLVLLMIDKILELSKSHVVGLKNITMNEGIFQGHFPGTPLFPGVLQIEAMAQTGGILVLNTVPDPENYITLFLKIENARFKDKVVPGDTIIFHCNLLAPIRRGIAQMKGVGMVGERVVVEAELMAQIVKQTKTEEA